MTRDDEILLKAKKFNYVAGVDESGAGNWAGNLIVAAVILDDNKPIKGLNDSKKLTQKKRFELYPKIIESAIEYSIVTISPKEIDSSNILAMRMEGMKKAINGLKKVDYAIIDGNRIPEGLFVPSDYLVKGDSKHPSISAASILAKTTIDMQMEKYDEEYPNYGFSKHKGYGTKFHRDALEKFGACPIHRYSYKPIMATLNR